jgi:putative thioredoxin
MTSDEFSMSPFSESAASAPEGDAPIETTTARFRADVLEASLRRLVLVDFWAPWCQPCRQLAPILERVVKATKGKVALVKMNIDEHPDVAAQLGVKSIPAVIAFQRGRASDGFVGALPEGQIKGFLERLVGPIEDVSDAFATAQALLEAGDTIGAETLLLELVQEEPPHVKAIGELARFYVETGRLEEAGALLDDLPDALKRDPVIAAAAAAFENAIQASEVGEIDELRKRAEADPANFQPRFDLALALNVAGKRDDAADALLDIIRKDRSWNEDGARKQLVQFFEAWGPMDKATISARRKLASLLFS